MQHVIPVCRFASEKRSNRQRKFYIISKRAKHSKTIRRIYILGNLKIVLFANKGKFQKSQKFTALKVTPIMCLYNCRFLVQVIFISRTGFLQNLNLCNMTVLLYFFSCILLYITVKYISVNRYILSPKFSTLFSIFHRRNISSKQCKKSALQVACLFFNFLTFHKYRSKYYSIN